VGANVSEHDQASVAEKNRLSATAWVACRAHGAEFCLYPRPETSARTGHRLPIVL